MAREILCVGLIIKWVWNGHPIPHSQKQQGKNKSIWYGARELITIGWDQRGQKEPMQEQEEEETRITHVFSSKGETKQ